MSATLPTLSPTASPTPSLDPNHYTDSPYNYTPTEYVAIIYVVLFSIVALGHLVCTIKYRLWWLIPTVMLASSGEVIGWAGRLWSSQNVLARDPFMMQIVCTIIAPTPFVAAIFITFGHLVRRLGERYSWLTARLYSRIFLSCDIASLIVQAAGGGIASAANDAKGQNLGSNIMLAGIIIQMVALFFFILLATQFFICFFMNRPVRDRGSLVANRSIITLTRQNTWTPKLRLLSAAMAFSSATLMIRAVYRTIELADGWNGVVISTQVYFNVFDGAMVVLAMYSLLFFHPGRLLFSQPDYNNDTDTVELEKNLSKTNETLA